MDIAQRVISEPMPEKMAIKKAINNALSDFEKQLYKESLTVVDNKYVSPTYPILVWNNMDEYPDTELYEYIRDNTAKIDWHIQYKTRLKPFSISCSMILIGDHQCGLFGIKFEVSHYLYSLCPYIPPSLDLCDEH
jgi:hypothetical protein